MFDGEPRFLCRLADVLDLAGKLLRLVGLMPEERQVMGKRGRAFVEQNFDERLVIERYLAVVGDVAANPTYDNATLFVAACDR